MNFLFPEFSFRLFLRMVRAAAGGAVIAGLYGIVHDQITYTISPEYFTGIKFHQFAGVNMGYSPRGFVAIIGFLASWWVGFFAAWFLARVVLPRVSGAPARAILWKAFGLVLLTAVVFGSAGAALAVAGFYHPETWRELAQFFQITDLPSFVTVAYIHNGSYLGGLAGLVIAIVYSRRKSIDAQVKRQAASISPLGPMPPILRRKDR